MNDIYAAVSIIEYNNKLLLIQRKNKDGKITYETPGGHVEKGETSEEAVIREVKEEAGLDVNILEFLQEFDFKGKKIHYFKCEIINEKQLKDNNLITFIDKNRKPNLEITDFAENNLFNLSYFMDLNISIYKSGKFYYINKKEFNEYLEDNSINPRFPSDTNNDIIASLTSFPERISEVYITINSLLEQTVNPDKIILWLSEEEFPEKEKSLPASLIKINAENFSIRWVRKNIGSFKKLLPALKEHSDKIIITFDDDAFYHPECIERLYKSYLLDNDKIHCHRAHQILLDDHRNMLPYDKWQKCKKGPDSSYNNWFTGVGGVLYPPKIFDEKIFDENTYTKLTPTADDIWFWSMALLNDREIKVAENNISIILSTNIDRVEGKTNQLMLNDINVKQNRNFEQTNNVLQAFSLYEKLKES